MMKETRIVTSSVLPMPCYDGQRESERTEESEIDFLLLRLFSLLSELLCSTLFLFITRRLPRTIEIIAVNQMINTTVRITTEHRTTMVH